MPSSHYHVASGLAGYGPDTDESTPTFVTLGDALVYARDELGVYVDMAGEDAHALADQEDYRAAWFEVVRADELEVLRANLDPARASAPLYRDDPAAYAALQELQAAEFPVDVGAHSRLYLWDCQEDECLQDLEETS